jgi:hypothetical protein
MQGDGASLHQNQCTTLNFGQELLMLCICMHVAFLCYDDLSAETINADFKRQLLCDMQVWRMCGRKQRKVALHF